MLYTFIEEKILGGQRRIHKIEGFYVVHKRKYVD